MSHKFPAEELTDDDRRTRAAGWIDSAILDLKRAAALLEGRSAAFACSETILYAAGLAENLRRNPATVTPTET